MRVYMVGIYMNREQNFITLTMDKMLREIPRYLKRRFVIDVIHWVKRDRHLVREYRILLVLRVAFTVQLSCNEYPISEVLTVAAEGGVKPLGGLLHTAFDLLLFPPEHIIRRGFQRPDRLAGRVIHIDVPERHYPSASGLSRKADSLSIAAQKPSCISRSSFSALPSCMMFTRYAT